MINTDCYYNKLKQTPLIAEIRISSGYVLLSLRYSELLETLLEQVSCIEIGKEPETFQ